MTDHPSAPIWITLRVADVETSGRFYRDVVGIALGETHTDEHGGDERHSDAYWEGADVVLGLSLYPATDEQPATRVELTFYIDDLDRVAAAAERIYATVVEQQMDMGWGRRMTLQDPDGNLVTVVQLRHAIPIAARRPAATNQRERPTD